MAERRDGRAHAEDGDADQKGALLADDVGQFAADQDERRHDQRIDGDRRLHAADGGIEVYH